TGVVRDTPGHSDLSLALRDGPEIALSGDLLDVADIETFVPPEAGKSDDLRRHALLVLAAGETAKADDYFAKARQAGMPDAAESSMDRIALVRTTEKAAPATPIAKPKPPHAKTPHGPAPAVIASLKLAADDIIVQDQTAYCVSASDGKILVLDISDPKNVTS